MKTKEELLEEVKLFFEQEKYQEIIDLLQDEVLEKYEDEELYNLVARVYFCIDNFESALSNVEKALAINKSFPLSYFLRADIFVKREKLDEAFKDYNKAIALDENYSSAYFNRARIWFEKGKYENAINDYNKVILLESDNYKSYNNRGSVWFEKKNYERALIDFQKALEFGAHEADIYRNIAITYERLANLQASVDNYLKYLDLVANKNDFQAKQAKSTIKELKRKLSNIPYDEISKIVAQIKELLVFTGECITHYTALSTAKILILDKKSRLRLSEGTFLNDTSEGRVLFKEINFHITKKENKEDKSESEIFTEKPFIGSFVAETKHDDLALWRMYGKENKDEARGCALTFNREVFINDILSSVTDGYFDSDLSLDTEFVFYNVAYISKNNGKNFVVPNNPRIEDELNELIGVLKGKLKGRKSKELKVSIAEKLNEIVYLFKDAEYQYENEVRLIVSGVGFPKEVKFENGFGVYIYLTDIRPALRKVTLGPKVEKAEEFAAALNYFLKEEYEDKNIEIIMSHLPFK